MNSEISKNNEVWKSVVGYEGLYEVSNLGNVRNNKGALLSNDINYIKTKGYCRVHLCKNGVDYKPRVHRLVAMAFIPNPNNLPIVNHKDENKLNNSVDSLEWCTVAYNNTYGTSRERASQTRKINKASKRD